MKGNDNLRAPLLLGVLLLSLGSAWGQSRVAASAEEIRPLLPGAKIPSVALQRLDGPECDLLKEVSRQRSILIFYRGGW